MPATLIEAPATTPTTEYTTLGYIEAYDAVLNDDYAFVAYKEKDKSSGEWRVRISSRHTAGGVFEPEAMRLQSRSAGAQGKPHFVWGFSLDSSAGDPRCIQFRVHVKDGKPAQIEMFVQTRNADSSAAEPKSVTFAWPSA